PVDLLNLQKSKSDEPFISEVSFYSRTNRTTSFLNEEVLVIRKKNECQLSLQTFSEAVETMLSDFVLTNNLFELQKNVLSIHSNELQNEDTHHGIIDSRDYRDAQNQTLRDIKGDIIQHLEDRLLSIEEESNFLSNVEANKRDLFECLKAACLDFYEAKKKARSLINSLPKPQLGERSSEIENLQFLERLLDDFTHSQQSFAVLLDEHFLTGLSVITKKCRSGDVAAWSTSSFRISKNLYTPNEPIGHRIINSMRDAGERRGYLVPYKEFCVERLNSSLWDKKDGDLWGAFLDNRSLFLQVVTQWLEQHLHCINGTSLRGRCAAKLNLDKFIEGFTLPRSESLFSLIIFGRLHNIFPSREEFAHKYTQSIVKFSTAITAVQWKKKVDDSNAPQSEGGKRSAENKRIDIRVNTIIKIMQDRHEQEHDEKKRDPKFQITNFETLRSESADEEVDKFKEDVLTLYPDYPFRCDLLKAVLIKRREEDLKMKGRRLKGIERQKIQDLTRESVLGEFNFEDQVKFGITFVSETALKGKKGQERQRIIRSKCDWYHES
ncbi:hypothetical protein ACFLQY_03965, partial [Verrucomicrobiota bacterium]